MQNLPELKLEAMQNQTKMQMSRKSFIQSTILVNLKVKQVNALEA